ncbi:MAG: dTDP-4-dehydrorhamnose reductase [Verrucomicrobia bacterium]|nr:dTDP-4-dehydrorhamnose reductase [Verrucomicrobiota bacterium]
MTLLVSGCQGQLGTDCAVLFAGHHVIGVDLPDFDITNRMLVVNSLDRVRPDIIINCSAYTAVDACETDSNCWKVNADGSKNLAEWATANGAFLVQVSTDYVFAGNKPLFERYSEQDEPAPVSEYGKSKLAGERAVLESGANAAILRTAWLYGASGKNFLKTMLRLAMQNPEKEIRVVNDQFGSPTWSHTLARQIAAVVEAQAAGVFHATSEGCCSWFDLASRFLSLMDVPHRIAPCTTAEYPTPARRPVNSILENAALKKKGINLFESWEMELERFVAQHRADLIAEIKGLLK